MFRVIENKQKNGEITEYLLLAKWFTIPYSNININTVLYRLSTLSLFTDIFSQITCLHRSTLKTVTNLSAECVVTCMETDRERLDTTKSSVKSIGIIHF